MSLLTSLLQASTRFQQAMDNRTSRTEVSASESNESSATGEAPNSNDDRFTPSQWQEGNPTSQKTRQLPLTQYKQTVAQDLSYVRETLRHKLAEYNIHPATAVSVSKTEQGSIQLDGKIPDQVQEKIEQDLNNNRGFGEALSRLSVTEPTLHFMDNALKLNQAYGVNNPPAGFTRQ